MKTSGRGRQEIITTMVTMGGDLQPGWLFGWLAADWSRPATNKSISSERKRKSLLFCQERKSWTSWLLTCCSKKGWAAEKSSKKGVNRKESVSSAHKLDGLGKLKEHAPRSEHVHLHQDVGHIHKNHLQATLLPQLSKYAHASGIYLYCA